MIKSLYSLRSAAAAAVLFATAASAQAGTVAFAGWAHGNGNNVSVTSPGYTGAAGAFNVNVSGFAGSVNGAFEAYCVDLFQHISLNGSYASYDIVSAASEFSAAQVSALGKLISYVYGGNLLATVDAGYKDDQSTAVQLAIWNIVYDTDYTLGSSVNGSAGGSFHENASTAYRNTSTHFMGANELLAASQAASGGASYELFVLKSATQQDQMIWRRSTVPEPASLALVALALGAAGMASRRRRS